MTKLPAKSLAGGRNLTAAIAGEGRNSNESSK